MDLRQLEALQAIAGTGSFSEAAALLGVTQSALSHQVRRLEAELAETLLIRARPKVYPSPAGLAVLATAQRVQTELMALQAGFARSRSGPVSGRLRIAATSLSIVHLLGDLCEAFIARHPGIELVFTAAESADAAIKRVLRGESDLAFAPLLAPDKRLATLAIGRTEHAFIVRRTHPLANRGTVGLDALRAYPFALFQPGSGTRGMTDGLFLPAGGYAGILTESNDAQFIKRVVSISNGIALMPVYALSDPIGRNKLRLLRCAGHPLYVDIGIMHRHDVVMNAIELFKATCLDLRGPGLLQFTVEDAGGSSPAARPVEALRRR